LNVEGPGKKQLNPHTLPKWPRKSRKLNKLMRRWLKSDCHRDAPKVIFGLGNEAAVFHFDHGCPALLHVFARVGKGHGTDAGCILPSHADAGWTAEACG
jgi:hypothetical protein